MKTAASAWSEFAAKFPQTASPAQMRAMKSAYYAGISTALVAIRDAAMDSSRSQKELASYMESWVEECRLFLKGKQ